jgi:hypothetical protein
MEFSPQLIGVGPKKHFIMREPSGVRIEFTFNLYRDVVFSISGKEIPDFPI